MKKNNIYINRIRKRNFEEALQKRKKSNLHRSKVNYSCEFVPRSFVDDVLHSIHSFLSTIPYFSLVRYFLLCHVNNNKSRVSSRSEESVVSEKQAIDDSGASFVASIGKRFRGGRKRGGRLPTMHTRDFETSLSFQRPPREQTRCRRSRASWQLSTFPPIGERFFCHEFLSEKMKRCLSQDSRFKKKKKKRKNKKSLASKYQFIN